MNIFKRKSKPGHFHQSDSFNAHRMEDGRIQLYRHGIAKTGSQTEIINYLKMLMIESQNIINSLENDK